MVKMAFISGVVDNRFGLQAVDSTAGRYWILRN